MARTDKSPDQYYMTEARAQHEPSGLWHYVRAYGYTETTGELGAADECIRRHWTLDTGSLRSRLVKKGEAL